jgi:hypothetical protein
VLCLFLGWKKPSLRGLWRTLATAQGENNDRGLKNIGEDELLLCDLEGRLWNIYLHTGKIAMTNLKPDAWGQ